MGSTWKSGKKNSFGRESVWTLADCEWRAAAPGLKSLRLPRAPGLGKKVLTLLTTVLCHLSSCVMSLVCNAPCLVPYLFLCRNSFSAVYVKSTVSLLS